METIAEFVNKLHKLNINCRVNNGQLVCNIPKSALTPELRAEISDRKAEILVFLQQMEKSNKSNSPRLTPRKEGTKFIPLSFAQERLWFLDQIKPGNSHYNIVGGVHLIGSLNKEALKSALTQLTLRHEILRTTFVESSGKTQQVIAKQAPLNFEYIDLTKSPIEEKKECDELIRDFVKKEAAEGFNLAIGPLLRLKLICIGSEDHVLLFTMHHIISDGWSIGVFVRELSGLYTSYSQIKDPKSLFLDLPLQYADFAIWQREWLKEDILKNQINYWKQQLEGYSGTLDLPTDRPRPKEQSFHGKQHAFVLSTDLTKKLQRLSCAEGVTLFMTLLGAFNVLLGRYSNQEDVVIGSPIANRNHEELEGLIGCFVNTLILRTDLKGNPSFRELLQRIKKVTLSSYAHQDVPLEKIIEELNPPRDLGRHPLFQVVFVLQNTPFEEAKLTNLKIKPLNLELDIAKFDLTLSFMETKKGLEGYLEYSTNLFNDTTITRMAQNLEVLLDGIVNNPDLCLSQLPLLTISEKNRLLVDWNTITEFPVQKCLHELFEEQVVRTPQGIALTFENQHLSYEDINGKANQLAYYLQSLGVGPNILVGICLEPSTEMIVSILAILKAGGAYLPLDPNYPIERLTFMLEDARALVVVTKEHIKEKISHFSAHIICLDKASRYIASESKKNLINKTRPNDLAYVIFTSGSTGQPKGSLLPHSNVVRLFSATHAWFGFNQKDVWTLFHSYAFDFSVWEIWGALLYGGRLVIIPYWVIRSPKAFYEIVLSEKVTVLNQTPPAFLQFIEEEKNQPLCSKLALRFVIFGGDALNVHRLKPWFDRHGDKMPQLVNMYGITETTVHVTYHPITKANLSVGLDNLIGNKISDLEIYVLDKNLNLVPIGVPGELHVGGAGLACGYLNRAELTASKFISHPFSKDSMAKLYKTGDLGRYLSDGNIEFLGRIDHQVKIRGFRIEIGEIETALIQHNGIKEVIILLREDMPGEKRLVAYWVQKEEVKEQLSASELRSFLKKQLPDHMLPAVFVKLESLPLTSNGKIDRKTLLETDHQLLMKNEELAIPRNHKEQLLVDIWSNVLNIKSIGIHDNFFDLGGDSILCIRVISMCNKACLDISIKDIFEYQTIAELASIANIKPKTSNPKGLHPFELIFDEERQFLPDDVENAYPLTTLQQGMLYHSELNSQMGMYHDVFSYHVKAPLNILALQKIVTRLVEYHPVLRTSFDLSTFKRPLQIVHFASSEGKLLFVEDISHLPEQEQNQYVDIWIENEKLKQFDYRIQSLLRFFIHTRSSDSFQLTLSFHHAILDGWSVASLMTEFFQNYVNCISEKKYLLPPKPCLSFDSFVALENEEVNSEIARQFWLETLENANFEPLPSTLSLSKPIDRQIATHSIAISLNTSKDLNKLATKLQCTLKTILLTIHVSIIGMISGKNDIVTGLVSNGRPEQEEGERILGLFLNTLPLRIQIRNDVSWKELVFSIFNAEKAVLVHRRFPLVYIQHMINSKANLFDTAFNFINFHVYKNILTKNNEENPIEIINYKGFEATNFTLTANFSVDTVSSQIHLDLKYDTSKIEKEQIANIGNYYINAVKSILNDCEARLNDITLFSPDEEHQQLIKWNQTEAIYPSDRCFHHLFEEQATRTPQAKALIYGELELSYQELNEKANQLAKHLRTLGIRPEDFVGIYTERNPEMMIGLLGILKAGAAYVPLDPNHPRDRIGYMIEDAQIKIILTQEKLLEKLSNHRAAKVCLDRDWMLIDKEGKEDIESTVNSSQLAYVIYTSGSTGHPKGVMITHQALINYLFWCQQAYPLHIGQGTPVHGSIGFDATITSLFAPLLVGNALWLLPGKDIEVFEHPMLLRGDFSFIKMTPAHLEILNRQLSSEKIAQLSHCLILGGEAVSPEAICEWHKHAPQCKVINEYGPTETVVGCCVYEVPNQKTLNVPIGRPIANTQLYILDRNMKPVPIGVPGELYIGGDGVARGYLNRPDLTAEKFIADPYGKKDGARIYKTGDLARYLPDGNIEYLGRKDQQVKIRGFRIELGEIETVLRRLSSVQEAVVLIKEDKLGNKQLVAYIVLKPGKEKEEISELKALLKEQLPEYMVPSFFVVMKEMPLTVNGKIDRKALPQPEHKETGKLVGAVPQTDLEKTIATIWQEVLGIEEVGVHDNFFDLGGHSLVAINVIAKIRVQQCMEIPVRSLYENPTVGELASYITTKKDEKTTDKNCENTFVDLAKEAVLDAAICSNSESVLMKIDPKRILLTGSTGFVGAFLLDELLKQTTAVVYCLVRCEDEKEARNKIRLNLQNYSICTDLLTDRIVPVLGDLSKPFLGLKHEEFEKLSHEIDMIYHNGANVNFMYSYSQLKSSNVNGTIEILKLASKNKKKPVHYISTLSIFSASVDKPSYEYIENSPIEEQRHLQRFGYAASKWVSEKLILNARLRGISCNIYRLGTVTGHSQTGACKWDDFFHRNLVGCLQLRSFPKFDWQTSFDLTPVDYVCKSIINLSLQEECLNKNYHLMNPNRISSSQLVDFACSIGYTVDELPFDNWLDKVMKYEKETPNNLFSLIKPLLLETKLQLNENYKTSVRHKQNKITQDLQYSPDQTTVGCGCQETLDVLLKRDIFCPKPDQQLLFNYFSFFKNRELF